MKEHSNARRRWREETDAAEGECSSTSPRAAAEEEDEDEAMMRAHRRSDLHTDEQGQGMSSRRRVHIPDFAIALTRHDAGFQVTANGCATGLMSTRLISVTEHKWAHNALEQRPEPITNTGRSAMRSAAESVMSMRSSASW